MKRWLTSVSVGLLCVGLALRALAQPGDAPPAPPSRIEPTAPAGDAKAGDAKADDAKADDAKADAPVTPPGPRALPDVRLADDGRLVLVEVHGTIDLGLSPFLGRVIRGLGEGDVLVLDINTFGGRVDAAVVIRDALLATKARTVCWVHPRAISAGALISLACDVIVVADGASIGAATPVQLGGDGKAQPVEEKMVSYMRSEMRATAEANGRDGRLAEAMVDADVVVVGLVDKGKLLTLDGEQALAWGIAELRADDEAALWKALALPPERVERPRITWSERVARVLSDPVFAGILMTLGMLGIMLELYSGGHGIALGLGLFCLALFFFGHYIALLAGWEEILLFVVGVALIAYEVLVPGHILPGVFGVVLVVGALVMALVNLESIPLGVAWRAGWLPQALASVFGSILFTTGLGFALGKWLPRTRLGRPLVLETTLGGATSGSIAAPGGGPALAPGTVGEAVTDLRPEGKARFGGTRADVVLDTGFAGVGTRVVVTRVDGRKVVVRALAEGES